MMERKNGRQHGEVFTESNVVRYILDEVGYISESNLKDITILEPSSGHGAFGVEILKRLFDSSQTYNFPFIDALQMNVRFIELNQATSVKLKTKLNTVMQSIGIKDKEVIETICTTGSFLDTNTHTKYNCIVGNPPYIRHELISSIDKITYKSRFGTFRNRADLYIPFFEHGLKLLKPGGTLSFICSNRWLYNQYGEPLRELISKNYNLKRILNIEKTSPFDEAVMAYPCITTIKNSPSGETVSYYETQAKEVDFENLNFREIKSPRTSSWQNLFLEYDIHHDSLSGINEQGFKIGIGVATGADSVFIIKKEDIHKIEKSRLLPLITSKDLSNNQLKWKGHYVINPYENGKLCDLTNYPDLNVYFSEHKVILQKRHTAQKSPDRWYQTIDKITPEILTQPKILLPDLTGNKVIFIDEGHFYPHHNIYYITGRNKDELKILACLLMSDFVKQQLSQIGIRMSGGLPRFQAQVLKKIKIPTITSLEDKTKHSLIKAYDAFNIDSINLIVNEFCMKEKIHENNLNTKVQDKAGIELSLF